MTLAVQQVVLALAAILALVVVIFWVLPIVGFNLTPPDIRLGTPGEYQFSQNEIIPLEDDIVKEHIVSSSGSPAYYPDEISCYIANDIYSDFSRFGDNGDRGDFHNDINDYIVGVGKVAFGSSRMSITPENEIDMGGFGCNITKYRDGSTTVQPGSFDEIFINFQLSLKKIGENLNFCRDGFPDPTTQEFREVRFGNNACYANVNNGGKWAAFCDRSGGDDFCDNGKDWIHSWFADTILYRSSQYQDWEVSDRAIKSSGTPLPYTTTQFYQYLYGVIWNPDPLGSGGNWDRKGYELWFVRIPARSNRTSNLDFLVDLFRINTVVDPNCNRADQDCLSYPYVRYNDLGFFYPEARKIIDINVTLTGDVGQIDLRNRIQSATYDTDLDYKPIIYGPTLCEGETDCTGPDPNQPRKPSSGASPRGKDYYAGNYEVGSAICHGLEYMTQNQFTIEPIAIKSNVDPNTNLKAGWTYRIVVYMWFGRFTLDDRTGGGGYDACYGWFEKTIGIYEYPQTT